MGLKHASAESALRYLTLQRSLWGVVKEIKHCLMSATNLPLPSPAVLAVPLCFPHAPSADDLLQWCQRTLGHEPVPTTSVAPSHKLLLNTKAATIISNQIHWLVTDCSKNRHYGSRPRHETLCFAFGGHQLTSIPKWPISYTLSSPYPVLM